VILFVMLDELRDSAAEVSLPDRNDAVETLSLSNGRIARRRHLHSGRALWRQNHMDGGVCEMPAHCAAPLAIPIADQHVMADQHAIIRRRAHDLLHEEFVRVRR
jgi:hypothetical protein